MRTNTYIHLYMHTCYGRKNGRACVRAFVRERACVRAYGYGSHTPTHTCTSYPHATTLFIRTAFILITFMMAMGNRLLGNHRHHHPHHQIGLAILHDRLDVRGSTPVA